MAANAVGKQSAALSATPAAGQPSVAWVLLKERADLTSAQTQRDRSARGADVFDALRSTATRTQVPILELLDQRGATYRSFWIVNALRVETDAATLAEIASRPEVERVIQDRVLEIPAPRKGVAVPPVNGAEWGLANIRAPEAWDSFGTRGEGIVIASIDTGVQFDHPALQRQYRGSQPGGYDHNYNWYDPSHICGSPSLEPCDNVGHGTHTMGTMVGDDGDPGDNQIGVAPHATWITAKGCEDYYCSDEALLAAAQWILAPTDLNGENPRPDLRPHIVNNSWGGAGGDPFLQPVVQAWIASGIFPAFSAGNSGPSCGSTGSPGDYPETYAAGAYDVDMFIAGFSSRGPSAFDVGKPNIAAPGVGVRSSVPGNGYDIYDGTSMASPHVAGTVALMWSGAPALLGDVEGTRALLDQSAIDMEDLSCGGTPQNNNVWGEGRLDAYAAVEVSPRGPSGSLAGTVRSANDGAAIEGALITARAPGLRDRSASSDAAGSYQLRLAVGNYDVSAQAFGYLIKSLSAVPIKESATTTRDFELTLAPTYALSGTVRDSAGRGLAGVAVKLLKTPLKAAITDDAGHYRFDAVPEGTYTVQITGNNCYEPGAAEVTLSSDTTLDSVLVNRKDNYGYGCAAAAYDYVAASEVLLESGDNETVPLKLPFEFIYYGVPYDMAHVSVNGILQFTRAREWGYNTPLPTPDEPNAAIYALWDDLYMDGSSSIRTQVLGTAPNRRVVVEWRDLLSFDVGDQRQSFEVVLYEAGQIGLQYARQDTGEWLGRSATIGLENETGNDGLQFSYNSAAVAPGSALVFALPALGIVRGVVTDKNDGLPIVGTLVTAAQDGQKVRVTQTNSKGAYLLQVPVGAVELETAPARYISQTRRLDVTENQTLISDFVLETARAEVTPQALSLVLPANEQHTRKLTLRNSGGAQLQWTLREAAGSKQLPSSGPEQLPGSSGPEPATRTSASEGARDTRSLFDMTSRRSNVVPSAPGDVLFSFQTGLQVTWGVGLADNLWFSDAWQRTNTEFTVEGHSTGVSWPTDWASYFPGDMAYDTRQKLVCQVNVGGDNGIVCWDPASGFETSRIRGSFPWTAIAQRGLAYRADDDSFYIGGWEDGIIYHIRGLSHAQPGEVLGQCEPPDRTIAGLAWNGSMQVLWASTNSPTDAIYQLNPEDCSVLSVLQHPHPGFNGAGMEMDTTGNLWTVSQGDNRVYLLDSGVPNFSDVSWLSGTTLSGTLESQQSQSLEIRVDTTGLAPGSYLGSLFIESNSGRTPYLRVPVSLVVTDYRQAVNAGGRAYTDQLDERWAADQAYSAGGWGYVQRSSVYHTSHSITGTEDPVLYQDVRVDPYAYRFDAPNGVYQVELRFAQLRERDPARRYFDVIIENTTVLPAYDIAYEVGSFTADDYEFFAEVTDGSVDIRFVPRDGVPVIAAVRVTRRPDRGAEPSGQ